MNIIGYFFLFAFVSSVFAEDWHQWRGPRGDGSWDGPVISKTLPEGGLTRIWKTKVFPGYSGVTVKDGLVYLMDKPYLKNEKGVERVLCLEASTGKKKVEFFLSG